MARRLAPVFCGCVAVALGFTAGASDAAAQIGGNNLIYACVRMDRDRDEGKLARVVAATEACRPREDRLVWNVKGPEGPTGATGAPGPQGPAGATGAQGPAGATGAQGPQGPEGPAGSTGPHGATGAQGDRGPQGLSVVMTRDDGTGCGVLGGQKLTIVDETGVQVPGTEPQYVCNGGVGPQGPAGPTGATGATGPQGPTGSAGQDGNDGATGLQGPQGTTGATGATGPTGAAGPAAAFKSIFGSAATQVGLTASAVSLATVQFTAPSGGFALVMATGQCQLIGSPMAVTLEIGLTAAAIPSGPSQNQAIVSNTIGDSPSFRSIALSRVFMLPTAGTYSLFLNAIRSSGSGTAFCPAHAVVFFTAAQLP